jgi:hypothetical protein
MFTCCEKVASLLVNTGHKTYYQLCFNSENVDLLCFRKFFPVMIYDGLESTVELRVICNQTQRESCSSFHIYHQSI